MLKGFPLGVYSRFLAPNWKQFKSSLVKKWINCDTLMKWNTKKYKVTNFKYFYVNIYETQYHIKESGHKRSHIYIIFLTTKDLIRNRREKEVLFCLWCGGEVLYHGEGGRVVDMALGCGVGNLGLRCSYFRGTEMRTGREAKLHNRRALPTARHFL